MNLLKLRQTCLLGVLGSMLFTSTSLAQDNSANTVESSADFFSKEKWGLSYFNYMNGPTFSESKGGSINHYLTLKHKFSPDWALSFVLRPDSNISNGDTFFVMDDPYLKLEYPAFFKGANGEKIRGDLRYYAPIGKTSSESKVAGIIQTRITATASAGRFDFEYILIPKFYLNTVIPDGQSIFSQGHWAAAAYKLSPFWSVNLGFYPVWSYKRNKAPEFNDLPAYPGFTFNFSKDFFIAPYVEIPLMNLQANAMSVGGNLSYTFL